MTTMSEKHHHNGDSPFAKVHGHVEHREEAETGSETATAVQGAMHRPDRMFTPAEEAKLYRKVREDYSSTLWV